MQNDILPFFKEKVVVWGKCAWSETTQNWELHHINAQ